MIMRAELLLQWSVAGRVGWAIKGAFSLAFISAGLHQCKSVLYMCSTLAFLLRKAVPTTTPFTLKTCFEGKCFWGVCIQAVYLEPFFVGV